MRVLNAADAGGVGLGYLGEYCEPRCRSMAREGEGVEAVRGSSVMKSVRGSENARQNQQG